MNCDTGPSLSKSSEPESYLLLLLSFGIIWARQFSIVILVKRSHRVKLATHATKNIDQPNCRTIHTSWISPFLSTIIGLTAPFVVFSFNGVACQHAQTCFSILTIMIIDRMLFNYAYLKIMCSVVFTRWWLDRRDRCNSLSKHSVFCFEVGSFLLHPVQPCKISDFMIINSQES